MMRILSLGGGQQSTAVYLLAATGEIPPIDYAIFADTGEEPRWVYDTVEALAGFPGGAPILVRQLRDRDGKPVRIGDQLVSVSGARFVTIPAFVKHKNVFEKGKPAQGKSRRQCTGEFKVSVIESTIRRELLGLSKGEAYRGERVCQLFGFDFSEGERIFRVKTRLDAGCLSMGEFPLWDLQWKRADCVAYVREVWGREILPSACTFCPLVANGFRRLLRDRDPAGHDRACEIDRDMRADGAAASRMMDGTPYVHRRMIPLAEVDLDEQDGLLDFASACEEGFCGH